MSCQVYSDTELIKNDQTDEAHELGDVHLDMLLATDSRT